MPTRRDQPAGEVRKRSEDEQALAGVPMRNLEDVGRARGIRIGVHGPGLGRSLHPDPGSPEDQQVQVEFARAPALSVTASEVTLDRFQLGQEDESALGRVGSGRCIERDDCIMEVRLIRDAHGSRRVEPGDAADANTGQRVKGANRSGQRGRCLADVRSKADVCADRSSQRIVLPR